jgi:hypothetical protein
MFTLETYSIKCTSPITFGSLNDQNHKIPFLLLDPPFFQIFIFISAMINMYTGINWTTPTLGVLCVCYFTNGHMCFYYLTNLIAWLGGRGGGMWETCISSLSTIIHLSLYHSFIKFIKVTLFNRV